MSIKIKPNFYSILLGAVIFLCLGNYAFAKDANSPIDLGIQIKVSSALTSVNNLSSNMDKLSTSINDISTEEGTTPNQGKAVGDNYNNTVQDISGFLTNLRGGLGVNFGYKVVNKKAVMLAFGVGTGIQFGVLQNVFNTEQGSMLLFDVPVHAYVATKFLNFVRLDGLVGLTMSSSSEELSNFTSKPVGSAEKGIQLLEDDYNAMKFDLIFRVSLSTFFVEVKGAINMKNPALTKPIIGLGFNFSIL